MTKCTRCNKTERDMETTVEIDGHMYGPECAKRVLAVQEAYKTLKGDALVNKVRELYKADMAKTTVIGMINKGMFPGIKTFEEFLAKRESDKVKKADLKAKRLALIEEAKNIK